MKPPQSPKGEVDCVLLVEATNARIVSRKARKGGKTLF